MTDLENNNNGEKNADQTWVFNGAAVLKYPALGEASIETEVLDRVAREPNGATLIHSFRWKDSKPFVKHQSAFSTTLRRVKNSNDQDVDTTQSTPINAALYSEIVAGGLLRIPRGNGEFDEIEKTREEMQDFARIYPESASEAIDNWLDAGSVELIDENNGSFDWMFQSQPVVKVLWFIGEKENPLFAAILTFRSPVAEKRNQFDKEVQKIKSRKQGEINVAELSESFSKKVQYGADHFESVEGVVIGEDDAVYSAKLKQDFITLFNPIWFVDAVEKMHESFDFTKGKAASS